MNEQLEQFVQDVYLTRFNRFIDDIDDTDGQEEVTKTIRWTNMFLDELEREADWGFVRHNDENLGTISSVSQVFELPEEVRKLVVNSERPLILKTGDSIVARFEVVDPNQITRRLYSSDDRVATVGRNLVFSREFNDYEIGATVEADVLYSIPRLTLTDIDLLDVIPSYQLLVLGTAKNATLPDIVQGGLQPAFVQKYNDELEKTKAENDASSGGNVIVSDDYGSIGGIW